MSPGSVGTSRLGILGLVLISGTIFSLLPSTVLAIPAWSRRYEVQCATCHYPAPPRLNALGHRFRRAQYRMEDELGKAPEWQKIQNYAAARIAASYEYASAEKPGPGSSTAEESTFSLEESSLWYAGPVTSRFTGFLEIERPGDSGEVELVAWVGGSAGISDSYATFRLGQLETLTGGAGWGGLDRSTGISSPEALSMDLTNGSPGLGGGTGFSLEQPQVGVEGAYVRRNWRFVGQVSNGMDADSETADRRDDNKDKDALLAFELMWGESASGLTAFAYRGVQDDPEVGGPLLDDRIVLQRYGLTAAQVWKNGLEVQGGYVVARDDYADSLPLVQEDIRAGAWWVEVEKYFSAVRDLTVLLRLDQVDGNTDVRNDGRIKLTGGVVWPLAGWYARLAAELRHMRQESPDPLLGTLSTNEAVIQLWLAF